MNDRIEWGEYLIEQVDLEKEVNFIVTKNGDYICRLIPTFAGFDLSPMDKALGIEIDHDLITKLSDFIEKQNA